MKPSNFYLIAPNFAEAGSLETLPNTNGLQVLRNDELERSDLRFDPDDLVCITSEASIELAKNRMKDAAKQNAIDILKDKYRFREILNLIFSDYKFRKLNFSDIESLSVDSKSILKPSKGCFGTAVKTITKDSDMKGLAREIQQELEVNASVLSSEVLSDNEFILEDYIEGEEYAVDMFYDGQGNPHIVNIYHHPMPRHEAYLHMIYYTSRTVFKDIYDKAMDFLKALNDILKVRNFAMHSEYRYSNGKLLPIEINSMRFGGMGLGNMVYYALGINPYDCFKDGSSPDWGRIWNSETNANSIYAFFIAYNGTEVDKDTQQPDIDKLKSQFTQVLNQELFDYQKQLALGVFSLKETPENLERLLRIDFNDYFKPI